MEFESKTIKIDGKLIKVQVWDTAGHEAFQSITRTYYKGAVGALLVYDITRRETFDHLVKWLAEVRENASKDITIILIGNKNDLESERKISHEEGGAFAKENDLLFLETSAKTAKNIVMAFNLTALKILNNIQRTGDEVMPDNIKINKEKEKMKYNNKKEKKKGCC